MPLLELDSRHRLHYQTIAGQPNRPWLVFLHEGLGSVGQWRTFPEQLCDRTGCPGLIYDRSGYGQSSPLQRPRTIHYLHDYALQELPRVIKALIAGQPFILIGHSDGGSIALIFGAERHPLLKAIITISAHVFVEQVSLDGIRSAQEAFARGKLTSGLARFHGERSEAMFKAWAETWTSPWFRSWNIEYLLPAIEVPLLVLQGRDDHYGTSAQVDAIVGQTGGPATPLLLEGCGHCPHLDFPELTLDLTACFVNRVQKIG